MKKIIMMFLFVIQSTYAQDSAEIWKDYQGINYCEKGYCAEKIPAKPLKLALDYYHEHQSDFENDRHIGIIDFSQDSNQKRFYMLNLKNGSVRMMLVTHGKNSEIDKAVAGKFSNVEGSEMSSLGFYKTGLGTYQGKHGKSLKLYGLSKTNSNAFSRGIVIHSADYATEWFSKEKGRLGLSQGCPAVSPSDLEYVINRLVGGGLLFIYAPEFEKALK